MTLLVKCSRCRRTRVDDAWIHVEGLAEDCFGFCPLCQEDLHRARKGAYHREVRRTEWRAANGALETVLPSDPWSGFEVKEK